MKVFTEFPGFILSKALQAKNTLAAESKTPEEIQACLGETFKFEGEKLNHFVRALDVIGTDISNLRRVVVMTLSEGENPPARSTKVEEHYYVLDVPVLTGSKPGQKPEPKDRKGGRGGKGSDRGPKESPWGLSPEEKAAKKAKQTAK
ncbi:MAG: hypothetical protein SGI74_06320 [Oligoflexia bacterium]|nr:hypothetical protein [Oligoflexia bacterium]